MPAPGGIPLATGSEDDRDGLEMDELSVSLGPVLPYWPAGLVLHCVLHGDLITDASVQTMPGRLPSASEGAGPETSGGAESAQWESAISLCDDVARLLFLLGRSDLGTRAERTRDRLVSLTFSATGTAASPVKTNADATRADAATDLRDLQQRLRRSRSVHWSLRGLAPLSADRVAELGLPATFVGDTRDRLLAEIEAGIAALGSMDRHSPASATAPPVDEILAAVPELVIGLDLGSARLVVAGLAPDVAMQVPVRADA